MALSGVVSEI